MANLKLSSIPDDKPVKLTVELAAVVHRDLIAYSELLGKETGQKIEPTKLVSPMLARFMATDRGFAKARRSGARPVSSNSSATGTKGSRPT
jgi:hypothetical protein